MKGKINTTAKRVIQLVLLVQLLLSGSAIAFDLEGRAVISDLDDLEGMECIEEIERFSESGKGDASQESLEVGYDSNIIDSAIQSVNLDEELAEIPQSGQKIEDFIPMNWRLESEASGDLNGDGLDDSAIVINRPENKSCFADDLARCVIVLMQSRDGQKVLRRAALNRSMERFDCALMSCVSLSIENGNLIVESRWGSRELTIEKYQFSFNTKKACFQMTGKERQQFDRLSYDGCEESCDLVTGESIFQTIRAGDVVSSRKQKRKAESLKRFESVTF